MSRELSLRIELLFFKYAGFFFQAYITKASFVNLFQMLLQKGNVGEFCIGFAGLPIRFNEALELTKFLKLFFSTFASIEEVRINFISKDLF